MCLQIHIHVSLSLIRQGQASCYEGSGRAPPLGPPPSVDPLTVPPTHKEGTGTNKHLHVDASFSLFQNKTSHIMCVCCAHLQFHPAPFSQNWTPLIQKQPNTTHTPSSVRTTTCLTVTLATSKEPRPPAQVRLRK